MHLGNRHNAVVLPLPQQVLNTSSCEGLESYLLSKPLVLGVSGGPDSLALLHILCSLRGSNASQTIHVAHLDHGLRGTASEEDARFVAELAEKWGLPYTIHHVDIKRYAREQRLSIEEAARNARYSFLATLARDKGAAIAVAHNADDQAETVLMHILRGSGISGLLGMRMLATVPVQAIPGIGDQGSGIGNWDYTPTPDSRPPIPDPRSPIICLFRPLLGIWRREIEAYCAQVGLEPRLDLTNTDLQYKRNRIRYELIPLLERDYAPAVKAHLHNLAELAAGEDDLIESLVEQEAQRMAHVEAEGIVRFEQAALASLPEALRFRLVRWAIKRVAGTLEGFTHRHIEEAASIVSGGGDSPRAADLPHELTVERLDGWSAIRHRPYVEALEETDTLKWPIIESDGEQLLIPGDTLQLEAGWRLNIATVNAESEKRMPGEMFMLFDMDQLEKLGPLTLRTRRPGDSMRPLGMKGHKSLHDLFIDAKIPRRVRDRIPLVVCSVQEGEVLWVPGPGGRRSAHAPIGQHTQRILRLEFTRNRVRE